MLLSLGDVVAVAHFYVNLLLICRFSPECHMVITPDHGGEIIDKRV